MTLSGTTPLPVLAGLAVLASSLVALATAAPTAAAPAASGWREVPVPVRIVATGALAAVVSCPSSDSCDALGATLGGDDGAITATGATSGPWTASHLDPALGNASNVSCGSPTSCHALGGLRGAGILTGHGTTWASEASAADGRAGITALACPAPTRCVAVGYSFSEPGAFAMVWRAP